MNQSRDLSVDEDFKAGAYHLNPRSFYNIRKTSHRACVFDLRSANDHEASLLPGSHNIPIEHFENSMCHNLSLDHFDDKCLYN